MGFLRRLFGRKQHSNSAGVSSSKPARDKKTWSKDKSHVVPSSLNHFDPSTSSAPFTESLDANKHAIAVAAATAAVAEAALAAAHAAAEVVKLTSGSGGAGKSSRPATSAHVSTAQQRWVEEVAAVKIQSAFRGYLARRALRALKALVKLQALVRGHIVRKQTADMLRRMQTLVRLQARARASRVHLSDHPYSSKPSPYHHPVPEEYEHSLRPYSTHVDGSSILKRCGFNANFRDINAEGARFGPNRLDCWMEESGSKQHQEASLKNGHTDDGKSDKILEVDTWKPHFNSQCSSSSCFHTAQHYFPSDYSYDNFMAYDSPSKRSTKALNQTSFSSREVLSMSSFKSQKGKEEAAYLRTAENSPQSFSASSRPGSSARKGPFTPARSEYSWGFYGGYSGYPNYMANTESFQAKVRSQSAPKQRLVFDRYGSSRRPVRGLWDTLHNSDRDSDFSSEAYAHSSHLNRIGGSTLR